MNTAESVLRVEHAVLSYSPHQRPALRGISLDVERGVSLGIVGESGSGKSSLARSLLGLETLESGRILYKGRDIRTFSREEHMAFRRSVQMVFQDPYNSLNPRMTVGQLLTELLTVHRLERRDRMAGRVTELLALVGLDDGIAGRYAHELSGGQRQRVGIARALAMNPEVVIADEPVSALDVSVQAQILNLLVGLVGKTGITLIMIAHDLAVVRYVCRRIVVMKEGGIVEQGESAAVIENPAMAYTKALLGAVPDIDAVIRPSMRLHGGVT